MTKQLCDECGLAVPAIIADGSPTYSVSQQRLLVRHAGGARHPINLPDGVMRFSLTRQTLTPILTNNAASLFALAGDLRLIEFHSKANALTDESMQIVAAAAKDHGAGIIVHNDAQHFSAGVDLNAFRSMIEAGDWDGIDGFLWRFQMAVKDLKYAPVPVVGAPSGLAVGGGFEVLAHCDKLVVHSNSVLGLVESAVIRHVKQRQGYRSSVGGVVYRWGSNNRTARAVRAVSADVSGVTLGDGNPHTPSLILQHGVQDRVVREVQCVRRRGDQLATSSVIQGQAVEAALRRGCPPLGENVTIGRHRVVNIHRTGTVYAICNV